MQACKGRCIHSSCRRQAAVQRGGSRHCLISSLKCTLVDSSLLQEGKQARSTVWVFGRMTEACKENKRTKIIVRVCCSSIRRQALNTISAKYGSISATLWSTSPLPNPLRRGGTNLRANAQVHWRCISQITATVCISRSCRGYSLHVQSGSKQDESQSALAARFLKCVASARARRLND